MRRMTLPLTLFAAVACQPAATPLTDEDVAAIRSLGTTYAEAILNGDLAATTAVYAEDAVELPPNMPAIVGKEAITANYALGFETGMTVAQFSLTSVSIDGVGGLAYDHSTWTWTGTPPGATEPVTETGKALVIARRQEDGSWLWTLSMWNSDNPPAEPQ